jgi:molybdopterin converting factor small subunit
VRIKLKITGRLYDAAADPTPVLDLPPGATVDDALAVLRNEAKGAGPIVPQALLAVSGEHLGTVADHASRALVEGDELVIFAPVAGG